MKLSHYQWNPEKDLIAEGGFAEVFKAHDLNTKGRYVALKIYKEAVSRGTRGSTGQKKYSLEQEFSKIDGLSHTHLITYYDLEYIVHTDAMGREASYPVLIMEYAGNGTLGQAIPLGLSLEDSKKIILEVAQAIEYLHKQGIIHRDIKPGNVLFGKDRNGNRVSKITDFGISQDVLSDKTIGQSMTEGVGTPHYMAPEQFFKRNFGLNGEISERTDIWALGIMFYKMLTKQLPFGHDSKDYELTRDSIINDQPDYSEVPERYKAVLRTCLEKKAVDRYASVSQFINALDEIQGGEGTVFIPSKQPVESHPAIKKKRIWPALLAILIIMGLGFGGYTFYQAAKVNSLLESGWKSYIIGDHKNAYDDYIKASEYESAEAYYFLSTMHRYGFGTDADFEKANAYSNLAIEKGYGMANFQLGMAQEKGWGLDVDSAKAKSYYKKAFKDVKKLSDEGNPEALNIHGIMYRMGTNVEQDFERSKELYKKAAEQDHPAAIENLAWISKNDKNYEEAFKMYEKCKDLNRYPCYRGLGDMYRFGQYVEKDSVKALELYKVAAENGDLTSQFNLGVFYKNGVFVKKDGIKAIQWLSKAAEKGHLAAQNELGILYYRDKNYSEAKKWFHLASEQGNTFGMHNMGVIYYSGLGIPSDIKLAKKWFIKAADKGYANSQYMAGKILEYGETGETPNIPEAIKYYELASEQNQISALYNLGRIYYDGKGKNKDRALAKKFFTKSAAQDHVAANYMLGVMAEKGIAGTIDYLEAEKRYLIAAKNGYLNAQRNLADLYYDRKLGKNKEIKATPWYVKAAEQGDLHSQYRAALIYYNGQYYYAARKWFNKASEQEHASAQRFLGYMYDKGLGGPKDLKKAFEMYRRSAENGDRVSMYNLASCYYRGDGTTKNTFLAKSWFQKSCSARYQKACDFVTSNF
ncbi:MAG: serine/threonine-protein kinase [Bacteroidota bacterium]